MADEQKLTISEVISAGADVDMAAWYGKRDEAVKSFQTEKDGEHIITFKGYVIESSWECFDGTTAIYEDGVPLYWQDARNVGSYHNETYTESVFHKIDDAKKYLAEKYKDAKFSSTDVVPEYRRTDDVTFQWDRDRYVAELEQEKELNKIHRIVIEDKGITEVNGERYHEIVPVYACDQKTFGKDEPMPNPYLIADSKKYAKPNHSLYLTEHLYQNVMRSLNKEGLKDSKWAGVMDTRINYYRSEKSNTTTKSIDIRDQAIKENTTHPSDIPFNEKAHNVFVKRSIIQAKSQKVEKSVAEEAKDSSNDVLNLNKNGKIKNIAEAIGHAANAANKNNAEKAAYKTTPAKDQEVEK